MTETAVVSGVAWGGPIGRALAVGMGLVLVVPAVGAAQPGDDGPPPVSLGGELDALDTAQEQAQRQLAAIASRTGDAREVLAAVVAELDDTEAARAQAEQDLAAATTARDDALAAVDRAEAELAAVSSELAATEVTLAGRQAQLEARVRAGFKYGQVSFLEAFLGTADIAEFLNSNIYVASVLEGDRALVDDVIGLLDTVERQRVATVTLRDEADRSLARAEQAAATMDAAVAELDALAATIEVRRRAQVAALSALEDDRASIESHLSGLEVESQRIGDQLAAIAVQQAEEAARRRSAEQAAEQDRMEEVRLEEARLEQERAEAAREAEQRADERRNAAEQPSDQEPADDVPPAGSASAGSGSTGAPGSGSAAAGVADTGATGTGSSDADSSDDAPEAPSASAGVSTAPDGAWARPVSGRLTSGFGPRWGRSHHGVDLAGAVGSGVVAARSGTVVHTVASCHPTSSFGCGGGFGNYVLVAHPDGFATIYAHLSSVAVVVGDQVAAGQGIGGVGNSGNSYGSHLHFEVREAGVPRNPCGYIAC